MGKEVKKKAEGGKKKTVASVKKVRTAQESEFRTLWETFRQKVSEPKQRKETIETILRATKGKLFELSLKHVEARITQTMLKFGDADQKKVIAEELGPRVAELAKLPYARYTAVALLKFCPEYGKIYYESVKKDFPKLCAHSNAAKFVDILMANFLKREKMLFEKLLDSLLFKTEAEIDYEIAASRTDRILQKLNDKALVHLKISHYLLEAQTKRCLENQDFERLRLLSSHFADSALHVASSRSGALGLCHLVSCADAKTRKRFVKSLKNKVDACSDHRYGYLLVWRLLDVTDDTVLTSKSLLSPLIPKIPFSANAARLITGFMNEKMSLEPIEVEVLNLKPENIDVGDNVKASKKSSESRHSDIRKSAQLLISNSVSKDPVSWLTSRYAQKVLILTQLHEDAAKHLAQAASASTFQEIKKGAAKKKEVFAMDVEEDDDETFEKKIDAKGLEEDEDEEEEEEEEARVKAIGLGTAILEDDAGHATLKSLLQHEASTSTSTFGQAFYDRIKDQFPHWLASNRGAFVLEALLRYDKKAPFLAKATLEARKAIKSLKKTDPSLLTPGAIALTRKLEEKKA